MTARSMARFAAVAGVLALAGAASADISAAVIQIQAFDGDTGAFLDEHAFIVDTSSWTDPYQRYTWSSNELINLNGGAVIDGVSIEIQNDPVVVANFNVSAGFMNTTFTVNSAVVSFPLFTGYQARASAAISVTDSATFGTPGLMTLLGLQSGGNIFAAFANNGAGGLAGSEYSSLVLGDGSNLAALPSVGAGGTYTASQSVGWDNFASSIEDISSQFRFTLSSFDRASGTSFFEVVPAPSSVALLGLGALVAGRRRRA